MNYHLNQEGQTVGIFPLEELRRRREAGELTGTELVWCAGMPQWQQLDAVLQAQAPAPPPATVPTPASEPSADPKRTLRITLWTLWGLGVVAFWAFVIVKVIPRARRDFKRVSTATEWTRPESASPAATKPVRWNSNTITWVKNTERQRAFCVRQYVDGYEKYGDHSRPYDTAAREMIAKWLDLFYSSKLATNQSEITATCDLLAANPDCDDPLLLTIAGANAVEMHEAVHRLERALKAYEHSQYKAYPRLYASVLLADKLRDLGKSAERIRDLERSSRTLLKEALTDGSILPEDQAEVAEILIAGWGSGFFNRNAAPIPPIVEGAGEPYRWLALMLEGEHQVNAAWKARGGGYSDTVTTEGWKGFKEHLAEARKSFTAAWKLRPDLPFSASRMVYVSLGDSGITEMRTWFDRAVAAQIDFAGAWNHMRWGLRPRWYGSQASMLAFGITALNTRRFDTDVPRKFMDSISDMEEELRLPAGQHIYGRQDIWPHLQQMYAGYIAEPSQAEKRDGWRSSYAIVAYLAGKYDVARAQLEAVHWQLWPNNLPGWGRDLSLMPLEVAARTGAVGQRVKVAENASRNGDLAEALRLYGGLSQATNADERTQAFARERIATLKMEQQLRSHQWVDFLPTDNDLRGWRVERGTCTTLADGALEVQSDQGGHIIFSRARVGPNFEARGTFEVVDSSTQDFQAGLVMGIPQFESQAWYGFRMKHNAEEGDVVSVGRGWSTRELRSNAALNSVTNSFYIRVNRGLVNVTVNDTAVFKDAKLPEAYGVPTDDRLVGLGAFNDSNRTVIRYRNVQVRTLGASSNRRAPETQDGDE